ncbi:unnamed protein product [Adineta ricciae]|uniref:C2 domain-containing protein n=1 Tax=Adineta ricciae TaxID=249248 RepID=A0A816DEU1_ADIRI|nr:unnamed protein product [Adineta ricciae]
MSHANGTLLVTIVEGRNLKDEDIVDKNDAYVELCVNEDYKQRTTTIQSSKNPTWNQKFIFYLKKCEDNLYVHVYDEDDGVKDPIGSASIDLKKHVFDKTGYDAWIKLPAIPGVRSKGEIHVILKHSTMMSYSRNNVVHGTTHYCCSSGKTISLVLFGVAVIYLGYSFIPTGSQGYFIDVFEAQRDKTASPLHRTLGFIRCNKLQRENIPLMEKYRPFFAELHYSMPNYTAEITYTADGVISEKTPYHAAWIRPFRFDDMNPDRIWFPVTTKIPFICIPVTTVPQWDLGLLHFAKQVKNETAKTYPNRFVMDDNIFCRSWADIYYIPRRFFNDFIDLTKISYTTDLHHETAVPTMINIIDLTRRLTPFHTVVDPLADCWGHCCESDAVPANLVERRCGHKIDLSNVTLRKSFSDVLDLEIAFLKRISPNKSTWF